MKQPYYQLSEEALYHLQQLFTQVSSRKPGVTRYNGYSVYDQTDPNGLVSSTSNRGVSHALNTLVLFSTLDDWADIRSKDNIRQCNMELKKYTEYVTLSAKQRRVFRVLYGIPKPISIWSNHSFFDWDGLPSFAHKAYWQLSTATENFFTHLALKHKMRPLVPQRAMRITPRALTNAVLEAVGCQWISPPPDYVSILRDNPNHFLHRDHLPTPPSRLLGNHAGTPSQLTMQRLKAMRPTQATLRAIREQEGWPEPNA